MYDVGHVMADMTWQTRHGRHVMADTTWQTCHGRHDMSDMLCRPCVGHVVIRSCVSTMCYKVVA